MLSGLYTFIILIFLGGWIIFSCPQLPLYINEKRWFTLYLILLLYALFLSIPLPLDLLNIFSPHRASSISMVNTLASADLSFASISYNMQGSLLRTTFIAALFIYFLTLKSLLFIDKQYLDKIIITIVIIGTLEALYGLAQFINPSLGMLWLPIQAKEAHGTIIYKNQYASFLNLCWPLAVGYACQRYVTATGQRPTIVQTSSRRKRRKVSVKQRMGTMGYDTKAFLLLFSSVIIMLAVFFSLSRGGILVLFFISFLLFIKMPVSMHKKIIVCAILFSFFFLYSSQLNFDPLISRFQTIGRSALSRLNIYSFSLSMLKDHWLTGIGLDSYKYLSPVYMKNFPTDYLYDRAHNEYLEFAIELGIPAISLFFTLLFTWFYKTGKKIYTLSAIDIRKRHQVIGMSAFASLIGCLLHGAIDFGWRLPANAIYLVTLIAIVSYITTKPQRHPHSAFQMQTGMTNESV